MARRKVTMLEAFDASAKEAKQRELQEQRRIAAERERAVRRRSGAASGRRLPGAGVVESLLSPFRGARPLSEDPAAEAAERTQAERQALALAAIPIDRNPGRTTSWESAAVVPVQQGDPGDPAAGEVPAEDPPASAVADDLPSAVRERAARERAGGESFSSSADLPVPPAPNAVDGRLVLAAVALCLVGLGFVFGGVFEPDESGSGPSGPQGTSPEAPLRASLSSRPPATGALQSPTGTSPRGAELPVERPVQGEAPSPGGTGLSAAERAFLDPQMRYSVLAITYNQSPQNVELAFDAHELLRSKGLPALRPYPWRGRVFVFVGASHSRGELEGTLQAVRAVLDPSNNRAEFRSAHFVNTADYRQ